MWVEQHIKELKATQLKRGEEIYTKKTIDPIKKLVFIIINYQNIKVMLLRLDSLESREYVCYGIANLSMSEAHKYLWPTASISVPPHWLWSY